MPVLCRYVELALVGEFIKLINKISKQTGVSQMIQLLCNNLTLHQNLSDLRFCT